MTGKLLLALCLLFVAVQALPWNDQVVLANSLIVGRDEDLELWLCATCDDSNKPLHAHYVHNKKTEIKCVLSVYPDYAVLAFRYTANALNLWEDLLYPFQVKDENTCAKCKVQAEYNKMWNGIRAEVLRDLAEIRSQTGLDRLYVSGISLGGGLAAIAFIDINHVGYFRSVKVVTFGAPRVGNKQWAAHFEGLTNHESRRYLLKGDPITVLPECLTLFCNYRHTGIKIVCVKDTQVCRQEKEADDLAGRLLGAYDDLAHMDEDLKEVNSIIDHIYHYPKIHDYTLVINGRTVTE